MRTEVVNGEVRHFGMPGAEPGCWVPDPLPEHLGRAGCYRRVLAHQRLLDPWGCTCDRQSWGFQTLHAHEIDCPINPYVGTTLGADLVRQTFLLD